MYSNFLQNNSNILQKVKLEFYLFAKNGKFSVHKKIFSLKITKYEFKISKYLHNVKKIN